jgi:hypothetical protein
MGIELRDQKMFEFAKIRENKPRTNPIQAAILYVSISYCRMSETFDSIKTFEKYKCICVCKKKKKLVVLCVIWIHNLLRYSIDLPLNQKLPWKVHIVDL